MKVLSRNIDSEFKQYEKGNLNNNNDSNEMPAMIKAVLRQKNNRTPTWLLRQVVREIYQNIDHAKKK